MDDRERQKERTKEGVGDPVKEMKLLERREPLMYSGASGACESVPAACRRTRGTGGWMSTPRSTMVWRSISSRNSRAAVWPLFRFTWLVSYARPLTGVPVASTRRLAVVTSAMACHVPGKYEGLGLDECRDHGNLSMSFPCQIFREVAQTHGVDVYCAAVCPPRPA